ncbi:MAG: 23S rRNA (guanosine(2251)-2'-O)-methyltransferase RlmB [Gammaproteobacteria bacterium]|nr:23S rRNA (guanosine(2251)-2'-O)-methyltransferase RlmB [Gammaproteobacteria bacterium]
MSQESLIFGLHAVQAAITSNAHSITCLQLDEGRHDKRMQSLAESAEAKGLEVQWLSKKELDKLSKGERHQGVVARIKVAKTWSEADLENLLTGLDRPPLLLVLDGVQDPHNLGACLRTADAVGVDAVIAPRDRACGLNATVRKVACGAAETVPFVPVTNLARTLRTLNHAGVTLVGSAGEAQQSLYQADLKGPLAIIMGAEEKGLRRLTREHCDTLIYIPMKGSVESLNVSAATAVCLYEAARQRSGI